ncbi:cytidine deaminase [Candidatus Bathyarchaeota archaeon]|nr:cytidine deaminase [Candidatus Bathyarchaeota archaeon]
MVKIGESEKRMLDAALKAMDNAYVLWGFKVGATVLAEDEQIYEGCNIESWISGLGICAERCAINHAILHDNRRIKEIAIVTEKNAFEEPKPCGMCLQYINDFAANAKIKIFMANVENGRILFESVKIKTLEELLPVPFKK